MTRFSNIPGHGAIGLLAAVAMAGGLAAAAAFADGVEYVVVSELEQFEMAFVGPKITDTEDDANYFVILPDGMIEGTWYGNDLIGAWDGELGEDLAGGRQRR